MTTTANSIENPTLLDLMKATDPDGSPAKIVEALTKKCPLLQDLSFREGNLTSGHRITTRTGHPALAWRRINEGVPASKGKTDQVDEVCGILEGRSVVDAELVDLNGGAAYLASQRMAFLASFNNELESAFFYASTKTTPEKIMGLSPRFDSTSVPYTKQLVDSQISASGSDQASIWIVTHSPETVYAFYPKGSQGGLQHHDMGVQMVEDDDGNRFRAWEGVWNWKVGLAVEDARYVVRLANIDTSAVAKTGKLLLEDMVTAYHRHQDPSHGRTVVYMPRLIGEYVHQQALDSSNGYGLRMDIENGKPLVRFMGLPIRITEGLLITEDIVT